MWALEAKSRNRSDLTTTVWGVWWCNFAAVARPRFGLLASSQSDMCNDIPRQQQLVHSEIDLAAVAAAALIVVVLVQ